MRVMTSIVLLLAAFYGVFWVFQAWNTGNFHAPEVGGIGGKVGNAVDGFGGALCKAWGC